MTTLRYGLTLYTLRDFIKTPKDIASTLHRVKAIGYNHVQLSALGPIDPKELKTMLDSEGLDVVITHVGYDRLMDDLPAVIAEHHLWGCKHVALGALEDDMRNREGFIRFAREGSEIGRKLADAGLTFSYHNHAFEFEKLEGRRPIDILFEDSDLTVFLAEVDTYWVQYGGADPAAWIRRLAGRQVVTHFRDYQIDKNKPVDCEVGEGNLNWPAILDACRAAGVEWGIVEQSSFRRDPFESVAISWRNLKAMGLQP